MSTSPVSLSPISPLSNTILSPISESHLEPAATPPRRGTLHRSSGSAEVAQLITNPDLQFVDLGAVNPTTAEGSGHIERNSQSSKSSNGSAINPVDGETETAEPGSKGSNSSSNASEGAKGSQNEAGAAHKRTVSFKGDIDGTSISESRSPSVSVNVGSALVSGQVPPNSTIKKVPYYSTFEKVAAFVITCVFVALTLTGHFYKYVPPAAVYSFAGAAAVSLILFVVLCCRKSNRVADFDPNSVPRTPVHKLIATEATDDTKTGEDELEVIVDPSALPQFVTVESTPPRSRGSSTANAGPVHSPHTPENLQKTHVKKVLGISNVGLLYQTLGSKDDNVVLIGLSPSVNATSKTVDVQQRIDMAISNFLPKRDQNETLGNYLLRINGNFFLGDYSTLAPSKTTPHKDGYPTLKAGWAVHKGNDVYTGSTLGGLALANPTPLNFSKEEVAALLTEKMFQERVVSWYRTEVINNLGKKISSPYESPPSVASPERKEKAPAASASSLSHVVPKKADADSSAPTHSAVETSSAPQQPTPVDPVSSVSTETLSGQGASPAPESSGASDGNSLPSLINPDGSLE